MDSFLNINFIFKHTGDYGIKTDVIALTIGKQLSSIIKKNMPLF